MARWRAALAAVGLGGALALGVATSAWAYGSGPLSLGDDYMEFRNGSYTFNNTYRGGMFVVGDICDTANDGDDVYGQGKTMGYGWSARIFDGNDHLSGCGRESRTFYDPAAQYTSYGWYQICTDDFASDTCDVTPRLNR